jgi:FADH2 O2-dependent halogenase
MNDLRADVAVIGAGFGGSLTALLCERIGLRPVLVERGAHPRFAIGESSTPIADLVLRRLSQKYDLPRLGPLTRYGSWKRSYAEVACGLKRGFSYFHHRAGEPFRPRADHANELLVAANPDDEHGDTHWYRADVDHFFVGEVQAASIPYLDQTDIESIAQDNEWRIVARRGSQQIVIRTPFVVDASGAAAVLAKALNICCAPAALRTNSWTVFSHFTGVERWRSMYAASGGNVADHPFDCDAAALHHVFDGGWMWVLRFDNGVTSAGFALDGKTNRFPQSASTPHEEWKSILARFPSIAGQFDHAEAVQPFRRTDRLQRRAAVSAGPTWAMLPHTAYFLDPWFSGGNAHTLCAIERLIAILSETDAGAHRTARLVEYDRRAQGEIDMLDALIHGCYEGFERFELMTAFAMFYFAAAITTEERRKAHPHRADDGFLLADEPCFREALQTGYRSLVALAGQASHESARMLVFGDEVARLIAPYNTVGLADPGRRNMYPYRASGR